MFSQNKCESYAMYDRRNKISQKRNLVVFPTRKLLIYNLRIAILLSFVMEDKTSHLFIFCRDKKKRKVVGTKLR